MDTAVTAPDRRTYRLDGFQMPISCARVKANFDDFEEKEEDMQGQASDRPLDGRFFDIEQVHTGGFVIWACEVIM